LTLYLPLTGSLIDPLSRRGYEDSADQLRRMKNRSHSSKSSNSKSSQQLQLKFVGCPTVMRRSAVREQKLAFCMGLNKT
jgi:hypothetical protein